MRSDAVKTGTQQAPHRSLFNALGMTKEEMDRPLVGIVSSYNEIVPGHMNLGNRSIRRYCNGTRWNEIFSGYQRPDRRFHRSNGNGTSV